MQIIRTYINVYECFKYTKVGFLQKKVYFNQILDSCFNVGLT